MSNRLNRLRFPVQWVIRPGDSEDPALHDYRGYAGQLASGTLRPGDRVVVLPSGVETAVASVETLDGPLAEAVPPLSVTVRLAEDVDVSRGDLLCRPEDRPTVARELEADVCWMSERTLVPGARVLVKHGTVTCEAIVDAVLDRVDLDTLARVPAEDGLALNDIGRIRLRTRRPLAFDPYTVNRATGRFILVDAATNDTVAGGMITR